MAIRPKNLGPPVSASAEIRLVNTVAHLYGICQAIWPINYPAESSGV
jgi:hypothetical protein